VTDRPSPRELGIACLGLAFSALLLWVGSTTVWFPPELTGAQVAPWLGGVALLALAGVAGVVAAGGVLRRAVGALLALAGAGVLVFGVRVIAGLRDQPPEATVAPLWAVAGALVLLAAGLAVVVRERRLPRLGARYAAPGERRVDQDPDRAAWDELDEGRDPTLDPPADPSSGPSDGRGDDPDDGPRSAPV
jgi:hypothetical protein